MKYQPLRFRRTSCAGILVVAAAALWSSIPARAAGVSLDTAVGTPGVSGFLAWEISESWNLRLGGFFGSFDFHVNGNDIEYKAQLEIRDGLALLDWYPGRTAFHLTAGAAAFGNELTGTADLLEPAEIGDLEFPPEAVGTLHASVDFPSTAFYVGFGFGRPLSEASRWAVTADLGVMIHATPDFKLRADGPLRDDRTFQRELENERQDIQDEYVDRVTFYPVLTLGVSFRL